MWAERSQRGLEPSFTLNLGLHDKSAVPLQPATPSTQESHVPLPSLSSMSAAHIRPRQRGLVSKDPSSSILEEPSDWGLGLLDR